MSLKYTTIDQLKLKSGTKINVSTLNEAFRKLVQNDNSLMLENSILPSVWECKWFNDDSIEGYSKGQAVWINAEPLNEFAQFKYDETINYLLENNVYRDRVKLYQQKNPAALFQYVKDIISTGKLFYIGTLTNPIQLKVSLVDNNKDMPLDTSSKWKDFFEITDDDTLYKKFIELVEKSISEKLDYHTQYYHIPEDFNLNKYLNIDISNMHMKQTQKCKNVKYRCSMEGFDFIRVQAKRKFYGHNVRWFRLWNSGYLEHGGIIDFTAEQFPESDEYTENTYTVNFNWKYNDGNIAPSYEFDVVDFRDLYCTQLSSDFGKTEPITYDLKTLVDANTRYVVSLTPLYNNKNAYDSIHFGQNLDIYETNSVNILKNNGFSFFHTNSNAQFSYYCAGFTATAINAYTNQYGKVQPTNGGVWKVENADKSIEYFQWIQEKQYWIVKSGNYKYAIAYNYLPEKNPDYQKKWIKFIEDTNPTKIIGFASAGAKAKALKFTDQSKAEWFEK